MQGVNFVFPHQLFKSTLHLNKYWPVYLIEEFLFFKQYKFHQQKIILHRASMKFYKSYLIQNGFNVFYIESIDKLSDIRLLIPFLKKQNVNEINYVDVVDEWLERRIAKGCNDCGISFIKKESPNFFNTTSNLQEYIEAAKHKYYQTDFYINQRKKLNILLQDDQKPVGGKWTFDAENRQKLPKTETIPPTFKLNENNFITEAKNYVNQYFNIHYGNANSFNYATTFDEAEYCLQYFLKNKFSKYGIYQDAISAEESLLFHSVLTPMLNIGLLQPQHIINEALQYASNHQIPINSLEGFLRQIIGWREFVRMVYIQKGNLQRTKNYWNFSTKIPLSFYDGTTGILPIDNVIKSLLKTGYNNHIERLMLLGNFMLLCEFDPNEVHQWFMEMYIDSYDWVMVPNVYGMTQFADGGLMTTKPYISGSNYVLKMSDYKKDNWCSIWDALFWRFMHVHRSFFKQNPRLGMLISTFDKMDVNKKAELLKTAETYLKSLQ